ncbi:hypothetical protein [Pseudomonas sp. TMP9]|uniref:helix-turn-helix domain-containing protein n=1 Tax=Pseudomonas sp. TMP9 TaxID=3133144 RepID=UPI0030D4ECCA
MVDKNTIKSLFVNQATSRTTSNEMRVHLFHPALCAFCRNRRNCQCQHHSYGSGHQAFSQQALASRAGVARTTVARMGTLTKGDMSVSVLVRLLEAAGYDLKLIKAEHLNFYLNDELSALLSNVNNLPPAVRG